MNLRSLSTISLIVIVINNSLLSQEIPQEFFEYKILKLYNQTNQSGITDNFFGPIRFRNAQYNIQDHQILDSSVIFSDSTNYYRAGFDITDSSIQLYGYYRFTFKKNFYFYTYPRIVDNPSEVSHYSGILLERERFGFRSGEIDNDLFEKEIFFY